MIKSDKDKIFLSGTSSQIFAELTLIFERLIKEDVMGLLELLTLFEAVSKCLRNEFADKEEK